MVRNIFDVLIFVIFFDKYLVAILNKSFQLLPKNLAPILIFGNFLGLPFKISPKKPRSFKLGGQNAYIQITTQDIILMLWMDGWVSRGVL